MAATTQRFLVSLVDYVWDTDYWGED